MNRYLCTGLVVLLFASAVNAQTAPDAGELTKLLNDFLWGASRNDAEMHDRFWAEELIYTGSSGRRVTKADIMKDVRSSPTLVRGEKTTYTAEDVRIQQYGDTAIVAFRLVGKVEKGNETQVTNYLNSGTFLKRKGKWQVVNWQATRLPRADADVLKEVASVESAIHRATLASDVDTLERLLDESFIWTQRDGAQMTRQKLLDGLRSGQLKYTSLENNNVKVTAYGDTAIVRGVTVRQRSAIPGSTGASDASPFTAYYTLTFINKGGDWKAVAMHSSRQ